jgi:hypothetical protein
MKKIIIFAAILLIGCATNTGAPFNQAHIEPKQDTGTIIFYREPETNFLGMASPIGRWSIAANDKMITALSESTYTKVELPPGDYKFNAKTTAIDTIENIKVKSGAVQYVKVFSRGFGGGWFCYIVMKERSESEALPELKNMALQINDDLNLSNR